MSNHLAGQRSGNLLDIERPNWAHNIAIQEALAFKMFKVVVKLNFARSQGSVTSTVWPMFIHPDMTWEDFEYAIAAEISSLQAKGSFLFYISANHDSYMCH